MMFGQSTKTKLWQMFNQGFKGDLMRLSLRNFSYIRVTLAIVTICSVATFAGVFKILKIHNKAIDVGANTDMNMVKIMDNMDQTDRNCQDRLKIIELENKIIKEQLETLFEFHEHDKSKATIKYLDD